MESSKYDKQLKPCPICGEKASIKKINLKMVYIKCDNCGCQTEKIEANIMFSALGKSIALWNTRKDDKAKDGKPSNEISDGEIVEDGL